jgi:uncharacterized protein
MSDKILSGIPVWHELVTRETDKAKAFYSALFGWGTQAWPMGEGKEYTMFAMGEKHLCGIDDQNGPENCPAYWITYFSVADADAATAANEAAGGETLVPPTDIPEVGRFSLVKDPQGALWCPFKYGQEPVLPDFAQLKAGDFVWEELLTSDPEAASAHYAKILGYEVESMEMGGIGTYHLLKVAGTGLGGVMAMPPGVEAPPHWLPYIKSDDIDATFAKAAELGGTGLMPPMDIPGVGRVCVIADPMGAAIAAYKSE